MQVFSVYSELPNDLLFSFWLLFISWESETAFSLGEDSEFVEEGRGTFDKHQESESVFVATDTQNLPPLSTYHSLVVLSGTPWCLTVDVPPCLIQNNCNLQIMKY